MNIYRPYCEAGMKDPDECYDHDVTYEHECPMKLPIPISDCLAKLLMGTATVCSWPTSCAIGDIRSAETLPRLTGDQYER